MKQKWLVIAMLLVMLCGVAKPLTVSAESSDASGRMSDDSLNFNDVWGDMSEIGFSNDMMITMTLFDGIEEDFSTADAIDRMHIMSAQLEPEHFYRATLDFICKIDQSDPNKYDDVNLQIRFPSALIGDWPNAIGYAINGDALETWSDTFGIDSQEAIDLYYLEDSGEVTFINGDGGKFAEGVEDALFASAEGLPISPLFKKAMDDALEFGDCQVVFFQIKFTLYVVPHQHADVHTSDIALNYWAGRKLMSDVETTFAPEAHYYTATMNENGKVILPPENPTSISKQSGTGIWTLLGTAIILAVAFAAFQIYKARKKAHEQNDERR